MTDEQPQYESIDELREILKKRKAEVAGIHAELVAVVGEDPVLPEQVTMAGNNSTVRYFAYLLAQLMTNGGERGDLEETAMRIMLGRDIQANVDLAELFTNMVLHAREHPIQQGPGIYIAPANIDLSKLKKPLG